MTPAESATVPPTTIHAEAVDFEPRSGSQQRTVGWMFGVTGLALLLLMTLVGVLMRFSQADAITVSEEWFYRLLTLHGAGMITASLVSMMGGMWLVAKDSVPILSYRRALASYFLIVGGAVLVVGAVVVGGFAAGWTFLFPLPFNPTGMWSTWATILFLSGMVLVGVGFVVYCIDVLRSTTETYGGLLGAMGVHWLRGRAAEPPPPTVLAATVVSLQGIIAGAAGTTILVALFNHTIDGSVEIDALWAKNLTYFFGHTVANLIIYLAAGLLYVLVPLYAGRQWKTSKPLVYGWLGTTVFVLTAYAHHLYMDFVQPGFAQVVGLVASSAAALPVAVVTIYTAMMLVWGSRFRWTLTSTLIYLGFVGWAVGGAGAVIDSLIPVNFRFHNTMWVPGHFHNYMLMGVGLWMIALVSYLLERASGRTASGRVAVMSPILMVLGGYGVVFSFYISGALGVPRRWAVHPPGTEAYSLVAAVFGLVFLVGLALVLVEFARMAREAWQRRDQRAGSSNPPVIAGGSVEADVRLQQSAPSPMVWTDFGLIVTVAMAVAGMFVFLPEISEASEASTKYHHLAHAVEFFVGAMLGAALASSPAYLKRFSGRLSDLGLAVAILAPVVMMFLMVPAIYGELAGNSFQHGTFHIIVASLGLLTGLGAALMGRVAGWAILVTSVGMALMYAPGVGG
jgi:cytochrome c oxidase subunit 1